MELPDDLGQRDKVFNNIAKDLFKIDFENTEFHFVMLSSLLAVLIEKGVITEDEFAKATHETGEAFKLMKFRNNLNNVQDEEV